MVLLIKNDSIVYQIVFDKIGIISDSIGFFWQKDSASIINLSSNTLIKTLSFDEVFGIHYLDQRTDYEGKTLIQAPSTSTDYSFGNYWLYVIKEAKWGIMDVNGHFLEPCVHDKLVRCTSYQFYSITDDLRGVISYNETMNQMQKVLPTDEYQAILIFGNHYKVKLNGLWGYFGNGGKQLIPYTYTDDQFEDFEKHCKEFDNR